MRRRGGGGEESEGGRERIHSNWPIMKSSKLAISPKPEAMSTKSGVHVFDINPYLHEFFEPILFDSIF